MCACVGGVGVRGARRICAFRSGNDPGRRAGPDSPRLPAVAQLLLGRYHPNRCKAPDVLFDW